MSNVGTVVSTVISTLRGRKGFSHWWDQIDEDIQREIVDELIELTAEAMEGKITDDDPYKWVMEREEEEP